MKQLLVFLLFPICSFAQSVKTADVKLMSKLINENVGIGFVASALHPVSSAKYEFLTEADTVRKYNDKDEVINYDLHYTWLHETPTHNLEQYYIKTNKEGIVNLITTQFTNTVRWYQAVKELIALGYKEIAVSPYEPTQTIGMFRHPKTRLVAKTILWKAEEYRISIYKP